MKVAILAGGAGNRLGGDTRVGPKTMIEIGPRPLLWHIMSHYSAFGFNEFVIATGHMGGTIKRFLADFNLAENDVRIDVGSGNVSLHEGSIGSNWTVDVIDTGRWTETAGRIKRLQKYLAGGPFMITFGDAVSDIDLDALLETHTAEARLATITVVHPPPRFGELHLVGDRVTEFSEKPMDSGWINGGFMVFESGVFDYIEGDETPLVPDLLRKFATDGHLCVYRHEGFWQSVDSMRDKVLLESLWNSGSPPWTVDRKAR